MYPLISFSICLVFIQPTSSSLRRFPFKKRNKKKQAKKLCIKNEAKQEKHVQKNEIKFNTFSQHPGKCFPTRKINIPNERNEMFQKRSLWNGKVYKENSTSNSSRGNYTSPSSSLKGDEISFRGCWWVNEHFLFRINQSFFCCHPSSAENIFRTIFHWFWCKVFLYSFRFVWKL